MQLQQETNPQHSIHAYDAAGVYIQQQYYQTPLLLTKTELIKLPHLQSLAEVTPELCLNLALKPQVFIIGQTPMQPLSSAQYVAFTKHHIGVECMEMQSACRTFNILLLEDRPVSILLMLGLLLDKRLEKLGLI